MILALVGTLSGHSVLNAQATLYDATRLMGNDLNGTARFVGMGGAMGALGGDISTMGTNPAGIGIYRSNDLMLSFGFTNVGTKSSYYDVTAKESKTFGSFDNAGGVFAFKMGNQTPLRFVNVGINYRRLKSFNRNMTTHGTYNTSQTEQMVDMLNSSGASKEELEADNAYSNSYIPWLGILGYNGYLLNPHNDSDGNLAGYNSYFQNDNEVDGVYNSRERGGLNAFDFNIAFNFYDRFYMGATLGVYSLDYTRNSTYQETFFYQKEGAGEWLNEGGYALNNYYEQKGSGVDFKLGFILRPFESSPLRIGAAIHTPILYNIREYGSASINYDVNGNYADGTPIQPGTTFTYNSSGEDMQSETHYKVVTPWKYNLSLGYTIGKAVALGAEYEYSDYSSLKMKYDDNMAMVGETNDAKNMLKGVHSIRVGAEFKLATRFALRVGYNHISAAMKDHAFKALLNNSVRTDTEYSNLKAANNYTAGFGYRGGAFYADLAYQLSTYNQDFHAFDSQFLAATKISNTNHRLLVTVGMRF